MAGAGAERKMYLMMIKERISGGGDRHRSRSSDGARHPAAGLTVNTRQHIVLSPPHPQPQQLSSEEEMQMQVGSFYEINHALLALTKLPDQLKLIRVVMVGEKTEVSVSLRFPSIYSLRVHFNNKSTSGSNRNREGTKKHPPLDEKYVISSDIAMQLLLRRVPACELAENKDSWDFWALNSISSSPTVSATTPISPTLPAGVEVAAVLAKKGLCWSQLKCSGMVRWGRRKQVRFLNRHDETNFRLNLRSQSARGGNEGKGRYDFQEKPKEVDADNHDHDTREESERTAAVCARSDGEGPKEEDDEQAADVEEETEEDYQEEDTKQWKKAAERTPRQWSSLVSEARRRSTRKRKSCGTSRNPKIKRVKRDNAKTLVVTRVSKNKRKTIKSSTDRWSAERYKLAEQNMLRILKEKGAVYGNPILRPALRQEARKLIGDTGLLDHLLKHMAGKVAPGGSERFRRRHNSDGAMEYWLESADLVNIRKEAGVQDPYWTPPPGWRPGDSPSQDPVCAREIQFLREEISKLKGEVQELSSRKQEEPLTLVTIKPTGQEKNGLSLPVKEMYTELMRKKSAMEEQLKEISKYLKIMKLMQEDMESSRSTVQETNVTELEEPITPAGAEAGAERIMVGKGKNALADHDAVAAVLPMEDDTMEENMRRTRTAAAEEKAARIQRLRSGFRICKPQGTFFWPNMAVPMLPSLAPPQHAQAVEDLLVVPTPPSVPSSPPSHHHRHQTPNSSVAAPVQPTSPIKPLAERRALSSGMANPEMTRRPTESPKATTEGALITISSISQAKKPSASPLVQHEQQSKDASDSANTKAPIINLNELPNPSHAASLTYKRRHHNLGMAATSAAISTSVTEAGANQWEARHNDQMNQQLEQEEKMKKQGRMGSCTSSPTSPSSTPGVSAGAGPSWLALATTPHAV